MFKMLEAMFQGTLVSLEIFFLTLLFALPLALPVAFGRMSKNRGISALVNGYLLIMRGTPLILQLIFVYFAPYYLFGVSYDRFIAVVVAYVINYAAYRGLPRRNESIPRGQYEAAKVCPPGRDLPHCASLETNLPSTANEVITLVKDTASLRP